MLVVLGTIRKEEVAQLVKEPRDKISVKHKYDIDKQIEIIPEARNQIMSTVFEVVQSSPFLVPCKFVKILVID